MLQPLAMELSVDTSTQMKQSLTKIVNEELGPNTNFSIRIFEQTIARSNSEKYFAITLNIWLTKNDCISEEQFKQQILLLQNRFEKKQGIQLRRLGARNKDSDLRVYTSGSPFGESQEVSRRSLGPQALAFEITTKK